MIGRINHRVTILGAAIIALALLIGWSAFSSWYAVNRLKTTLSARNLRNFEIADHLQATVLQLNNSIINFELRRDQADLATFFKTSSELNDWIDRQKVLLVSMREHELLNRIDAAYDVFLSTATNDLKTARMESSSDKSLTRINEIVRDSLVLLDLGYQLENAHREALEEIMFASQESVALLQRVIFLSLFLLLGSVIWLSLTVYREIVTPLRAKLDMSKTIIERQERLASLGMLAAGVAHEIRNPLTAIKARLFTLRQNLDRVGPEWEDAEVIGNEINRLEKIVKSVLQFARPAEPEFQMTNLNKPLEEVSQLLAPELDRRGIKLQVELNGSTPVKIDPEQIKQVLINLVQNAADSITGNGMVQLRIRKGAGALNGKQQTTIRIDVQDNGSGISPEVEKRLFDPFFSTKDTGAGLGLPIAARIVEKHGGELQYETGPGRGATFSIVLPAESIKPGSENTPPSAPKI